MRVSIVQIGNSKGLRIPKAILEQCSIEDEVDLEVKDKRIILEPTHKPARQGWEEHFSRMAENADDRPIVNDAFDLDFDDWEW